MFLRGFAVAFTLAFRFAKSTVTWIAVLVLGTVAMVLLIQIFAPVMVWAVRELEKLSDRIKSALRIAVRREVIEVSILVLLVAGLAGLGVLGVVPNEATVVFLGLIVGYTAGRSGRTVTPLSGEPRRRAAFIEVVVIVLVVAAVAILAATDRLDFEGSASVIGALVGYAIGRGRR